MELSLEAYRNIVQNVGSRADLATLCRVSKGFQYVCERAFYNTLYLRDIQKTMAVCATLGKQPRVSMLVEALTIFLSDDGDDDEADDGYESAESGRSESDQDDEGGRSGSPRAAAPKAALTLPDTYWATIAYALEQTTYLRFLNFHISGNHDKAIAWIFKKCTFRLRRFHCDLDWDQYLVAFLNTQDDLDDLYIIDYNEHNIPTPIAAASGNDTSDTSLTSPGPSEEATDPTAPSPSLSLDTRSLPKLNTLECTFSEAAIALVPGRPITHLKTCFSHSGIPEKRTELDLLFSKIKLSTRSLRSLDIADSDYSESFSLELLSAIVRSNSTTADLRYVGTLVLPILGKERLQFYAFLMRLPRIQCVEVEVSEWVPPPSTPAAFRALASEIRLYSPTVTRVVFVHDFDRTVVTAVNGVCRVDPDVSVDILWREQ